MGTSQVENKTIKGTGKGPSSKGQVPCWINPSVGPGKGNFSTMALGKVMEIAYDSISYISLC